MIAFLGMGLLGSNFTRALRRRGEAVQVWNRSLGKARTVAAETGATAFDDPAKAVQGATRVHLVLSDDAAVDEVLERAKPGLGLGVPLVDHTTTSPSGASERTKKWQGRGHGFQHAPVFMGPQQALEGQGIMLASGEQALFERLEPELKKMTGKLVWVGEPPGKAASIKLLGNQFLMAMTAGLVDTLALAKDLELEGKDVESLFSIFNPGAMLPARLRRILAADYANPSWSLAMARKDARLMLEAAKKGGQPLTVLPAVAALMDRLIAEGHASEDWTVIAKDVVK